MNIIDLQTVLGEDTRFLSTRPSGREAATTLGVRAAFAGDAMVRFVVPDDMIEISPSFTLGLFETAVADAGSVDAVLSRLRIQAPRRIVASMVGALRRGFAQAQEPQRTYA